MAEHLRLQKSAKTANGPSGLQRGTRGRGACARPRLPCLESASPGIEIRVGWKTFRSKYRTPSNRCRQLILATPSAASIRGLRLSPLYTRATSGRGNIRRRPPALHLAAELFVSVKTVEVNMARIHRQLGSRSCAELWRAIDHVRHEIQ